MRWTDRTNPAIQVAADLAAGLIVAVVTFRQAIDAD
jgi:hypothetical protein